MQEVRKLLGWSRQAATPYHFRAAAGQEVGFEAPGQRIAGMLYLGEQRLPFADKLWALPISALWE